MPFEKTPDGQNPHAARPWQLLVLSARSESAVDRASANLARHFKRRPGLHLGNATFTLLSGRRLFDHRRMAVCRDLPDAVSVLENGGANRVRSFTRKLKKPSAALLFPDAGAARVNLARGIHESESVFRKEFDRCVDHFKPLLGLDAREVIHPSPGNAGEAANRLAQPRFANPALFAVEYALARLWISWGVPVGALMGRGVGEVVSACLAGILSLEDATRLLVLAGDFPSEEGPAPGAARKGLPLNDFNERLRGIALNPPKIPCLSGSAGTWITEAEAADPGYWKRVVRPTTGWGPGLDKLLETPDRVLLTVGPGAALDPWMEDRPPASSDPVWLHSIPDPGEAEDLSHVIEALGALYCSDIKIDWHAFYNGRRPRRVPLPGYPFERVRCWFVPGKSPEAPPREARPGPEPPGVDPAPGGRETGENEKKEPRRRVRPARRPDGTPRNRIEAHLATLCQELLGIEPIRIFDNVVALGMDSITVMRLSKQVNAFYHTDIMPHHLFNEPTIASAAERIREKTGDPPTPPSDDPAEEPFETPRGNTDAAEAGVIPDNLMENLHLLEIIESLPEEKIEALPR